MSSIPSPLDAPSNNDPPPVPLSPMSSRDSSNSLSTSNNKPIPPSDVNFDNEYDLYPPYGVFNMTVLDSFRFSLSNVSTHGLLQPFDTFGYPLNPHPLNPHPLNPHPLNPHPLNPPTFGDSETQGVWSSPRTEHITQFSKGIPQDIDLLNANAGAMPSVARGQFAAEYLCDPTISVPYWEESYANSSEGNGSMKNRTSHLDMTISNTYNLPYPKPLVDVGVVPSFTTASQQYISSNPAAFDLPFGGPQVSFPGTVQNDFRNNPLPSLAPQTSNHFDSMGKLAYPTCPPTTFAQSAALPRESFPSTSFSTYLTTASFTPEAQIAGPSRIIPREEKLRQPLANPMDFGILPGIPPSPAHCVPKATVRKRGPCLQAPQALAPRRQTILESSPAEEPGVSPHELPSSTQRTSNTDQKEKKSGKAKPVKTKRRRKNPYAVEKPRTDDLVVLPPKDPLGRYIDGVLHLEVTASAHPSLFNLLPTRTSDYDLPGMRYLPVLYPPTFKRAIRCLPPAPIPQKPTPTSGKRRRVLKRKSGRPTKALAYLGYVDDCACACGRGFGADRSTADHVDVRDGLKFVACEVHFRQGRAVDPTRCIFCGQAMQTNWDAHFSSCVLLKEARTLILKDHIEDHGLLPCEIDVFPWPAAGLGETPSKK